MSNKALSAVWDRSSQKGAALLLLLTIADFSNDEGGGAYPSHKTLAQKTRLHPDSIKRLLRDVERSGELSTEVGAGPRGTNVYRIYLDRLGTLPGVEDEGGATYGGDPQAPGGQTITEGGSGDPARGGSPDPPNPYRTPREPIKKTPPLPLMFWEARFPDFYAAYPRKTGKAAAFRAWMNVSAVKRVQEGFDVIMAGLAAYVTALGPDPDLKYVPHPSTWLNGERWEDDPAAAAATSASRQRGAGPPLRPDEAPIPDPPPRDDPAAYGRWLRDPASARHRLFRGADGQRRRREEIARLTQEDPDATP